MCGVLIPSIYGLPNHAIVLISCKILSLGCKSFLDRGATTHHSENRAQGVYS